MSSNHNVKVHFAGCDNNEHFISCMRAAGVNYGLFTAYPFIRKKSSDQDMRVARLAEMDAGFKHLIMDSGLFTMMFGADKGTPKTPEFVREWMHRICAFTTQNKVRASIVECDCQKIISPEFAWKMRREMREIMPEADIINVFHLEDGEDGFRRMVDFASYIAISVPELRIAQPKSYRNTVCSLARMAKRQKPDIRIHLLGCTEKYLLERNTFCTSADSSSWSAPVRFGTLEGIHISNISDQKKHDARHKILRTAESLGMKVPSGFIRGDDKSMKYMSAVYYSVSKCLRDYTTWAGPQD